MHDMKNDQEEMYWMKVEIFFRGHVPLFAGAAVPAALVTTPDGARTIPGWLTVTGPSRLMMSLSLVLLA